jgi:hypothetical protein
LQTPLTRRRALALAAATAAVLAYVSAAADLPQLPLEWDVVVVGFLVLPAALALVALALPLVARPPKHPLALPLAAGIAAVALGGVDLWGPFQVAKLAAFAFVGLVLIWLFDSLWWVTVVAAVIPWVDIWSVSAGPTKRVIEDRPSIIEHVAVGFPFPDARATIYLGPPDVIFFAIFLGIAARCGLRLVWTWISMSALLGLTLAAVVYGTVSGLPALPAVCFGFLLPNIDLLWRDVRDSWRARRAERPAE